MLFETFAQHLFSQMIKIDPKRDWFVHVHGVTEYKSQEIKTPKWVSRKMYILHSHLAKITSIFFHLKSVWNIPSSTEQWNLTQLKLGI